MARAEWITDILSGRKTPFREVATNAWRAQYNRRVITQQAKELSRLQSMGPVGKTLRTLWMAPRSLLAMDQLLGRETGRVFNDEALAVAAGTKSPEQAAQAIENSWSQNRIWERSAPAAP
jgi:hypothetical protein